jgi:hypothetical protein
MVRFTSAEGKSGIWSEGEIEAAFIKHGFEKFEKAVPISHPLFHL